MGTTTTRSASADAKIQLRHPAGKKAVRISRDKYDLLKASLRTVLKKRGTGSHTELLQAVTADLKARGTAFSGSIEWYLEWVKLDLEARGTLQRVAGSTPQQFRLRASR